MASTERRVGVGDQGPRGSGQHPETGCLQTQDQALGGRGLCC